MDISEFTQKPTSGATYAKNEVPAFVITTNRTLLAILSIGAEVIFKGIYAPDFNGQISIDFRGLYDNYLKTLIPTTGSDEITHTDYRRLFTATFQVVVGEDSPSDNNHISWYVANAKLKSDLSFSAWSEANFLTNQPIEKTTNYEAPEWLTWWDHGTDIDLVARFYKKNGTSVDVTVRAATNAGIFSANVRYSRLIRMANVLPSSLLGYYDLILIDAKDDEVCRQRYIYEERTGREKYFLFVNALGGIDTLICAGENVLEPEITHNVGRFGRQYRALDDTDDMRKWSQHTGMVPSRQRNWIYELLTAKQGAEKYDPETMKYFEIVVDSSDISMSDNGQLTEATFGYILNETENVVADTERPDRSLHQSVAEQAEEFYDLSSNLTLAFEAGEKVNVTEVASIAATKLYVTWDENLKDGIEVFVEVDGNSVGSFVTGTDTQPFIVTKTAGQTVQFLTIDDTIESVTVTYYPVTVQAV